VSSSIQAIVTVAPAATAVKDAPTPQSLPAVDPSIPSAPGPGVTTLSSAPSPRVLLQLLLLCIALLV
jgi:hypothetical protein